MGLSGPRKKTKISHDPNNTAWARSTENYGHRIMSAQGWAPGNLLGNGNTSYKEHLTAASSGHIRVILKDDNLGLGAKPKSKRDDEPTGLDAFQDLLGRLNGKSDTEIKTDQRKREDVKLLGYVGKRWGTMRFVRGEMLVQDKMPESSRAEKEEKEESVKEESKKEKKKGRKEKAGDTSDETDKSKKKDKKKKKDKEKKKSKDRKAESESDESDKSKKRKRKDKGSKSEKSESEEESETQVEAVKPSTAALFMAKERRPMGRHVIRSRHIMEKKRALMDDKSLNEIFMVKS